MASMPGEGAADVERAGLPRTVDEQRFVEEPATARVGGTERNDPLLQEVRLESLGPVHVAQGLVQGK